MIVFSFGPPIIFLHFYLPLIPPEFFFIVIVAMVLRVMGVYSKVPVYWLLHVMIESGFTITFFPSGL